MNITVPGNMMAPVKRFGTLSIAKKGSFRDNILEKIERNHVKSVLKDNFVWDPLIGKLHFTTLH